MLVCNKRSVALFSFVARLKNLPYGFTFVDDVGRSSQADYLMRNVAMDDSIGGS